MKTVFLACVLLALLLVACTSIRPLAEPSSLEELHALDADVDVQLYLFAADSVTVSRHLSDLNVRIGVDSTTWIDPSTLMLKAVPTRSVAMVRHVNHASGLGKGLLFGLLIGGIPSYAAAELSGGSGGYFGPEVYGAVFGGLGMVFGGLIGGAVGEDFRYVADPDIDIPTSGSRMDRAVEKRIRETKRQ